MGVGVVSDLIKADVYFWGALMAAGILGSVPVAIAYAFLVDATLFAAAPGAGRLLPGKAGDALAGQPVEGLLSPVAGAAALAAWTLASVVAAAVRNDRSDVQLLIAIQIPDRHRSHSAAERSVLLRSEAGRRAP